ncbi:MAG: 50S ribosomal protein L24 [Firmicutes bacterium]|nr:50S ribosomal protein L24 [Bacillota bacterium]
MKIKKGDTVVIIAGKDRGKRGKVLRVVPKTGKVIVEGLNIVKKHQRPTQEAPQGGVVETPAPIDRSNVQVVCGSCRKPTRVGVKVADDGERTRICKKCGAEL